MIESYLKFYKALEMRQPEMRQCMYHTELIYKDKGVTVIVPNGTYVDHQAINTDWKNPPLGRHFYIHSEGTDYAVDVDKVLDQEGNPVPFMFKHGKMSPLELIILTKPLLTKEYVANSETAEFGVKERFEFFTTMLVEGKDIRIVTGKNGPPFTRAVRARFRKELGLPVLTIKEQNRLKDSELSASEWSKKQVEKTWSVWDTEGNKCPRPAMFKFGGKIE